MESQMEMKTNQEVLTIGDQPEFCGHLGQGLGICAPPVLAADQRVLLSRSYFTIPFMAMCGIAGPPAASDGRFVPVQTTYMGGYTGIGQAGDFQGNGTRIRDVQTGLQTSFATDGYPHKTRTLRVRAIGIMPEAQPFIPANYALDPAGNFNVSIGGSAALAGENVVIPEPLSTTIGPALVNSFMSFYRFQLGLQDEQTKWLFGPQHMNIAGLGLYGGPVQTNAEPIGGKMIKLPFAIDVPPQQSRKGIVGATWEFVRDNPGILASQAWVDPALCAVGATPVCNNLNTWAGPTASPAMLVQMFKVFLFGEAIFAEDKELQQRVQQIMCETKCDEQTARNLCAKLGTKGQG
jgi:hypothetical protein